MLYKLTGETRDGAKPCVKHVVAIDGDDALAQGERLFGNPRHLTAERLDEDEAPTTITCRGCGRSLTAEQIETNNGPQRKYCRGCSR